jgi:manganese/zinc/iron transport system permease protein
MSIGRTTRIKQDASLGLVLSVFFGIGLVLLTYIQRLPEASKAGLDSFLFGQAAAMLERDVWTMAVLGGIAIVTVVVFWKEFKLISFDPQYAATLGFPVRALDVLLTTLLVIAIVIGLQSVGVVLMSAMVVAPAAAARQWTDRLSVMVVVAATFGAVSGVLGAVASSNVKNLPTGPTIVIVASALAIASFAFAPRRGLIAREVRRRRSHSRLRAEALLADLYLLSLQHSTEHGHSAEAIAALRPGLDCEASLASLESKGYVRRAANGGWTLTTAGAAMGAELTELEGELPETLREAARR